MGWEAAVIAISTAVIALMGLIGGLMALVWFRDLSRVLASLERFSNTLEHEAKPALHSAKELADDASKIVGTLRKESEQLADVSSNIRSKIAHAADAVEERLVDLDALVDVAQTELEDTVLDVAAALHTGRRGASLVRRLGRALARRRRR